MFYSKQTGGFYDSNIHGDNIPADAVEITSEQHAALLQGQSEGKVIAADASGRPVLADPPAPTPEQLATQIRAERDAKLQASTWLVERHREELEAGKTTLTSEEYQAVLSYRQALRDITEQAGFPNQVEWPVSPEGL